MAATQLAAMVAAAVGLATSPCLAAVADRAPQRQLVGWWRARPTRPGVLVVIAPLFAAAAGLGAGWSASWPAFVVVGLCGAVLALVDWREHRLPDRIVYPCLVLGAALLATAAGVGGTWHRYWVALACAAVTFAVFFAVWFALPGGLGFGDVKLAGLLGLYLGWFGAQTVLAGVFAGFVLAAAVALAGMLAGRTGLKSRIALGPMLVAGALAVIALAGV